MSFEVKWLYKLQEDFYYQSRYKFDSDYAYLDEKGVTRMEIYQDGVIRILNDYCWDGCSPKFKMLDIPFGTPDGITDPNTLRPKTYYASLVHDALCQFFLLDVGLSKREVDKVFLDLMGKSKFKPRYLYYAFVRIFGYLLLLKDKLFRRNVGTKVLL